MPDEFPVPSPTVTFLGGPLDGLIGEPDVDPALDIEWPGWFAPADCDGKYSRITPGDHPAWIVRPPQMDVFDAVYLWSAYFPPDKPDDDGGSGGGVPLKPYPQLLS